MYVNDLGMRDVSKLQPSYRGNSKTSQTGKSFAQRLQEVLEQDTSGEEGADFCCKKCSQLQKLTSQMIMQNLFMGNRMYGMGLSGMSSFGLGSMFL